MNNFKDYLNFSPNPRDNFFKLSQISLQENHYMKLCESLKEKINLLEAKIKKKKKKMANKDYDGDGKVESSKDEYFGSKDKAIKAAMKKKKSLKEGREVVGGGLIYGGFPKVLKEQQEQGGVVDAYNDADDNPGEPAIATLPDKIELLGSWSGDPIPFDVSTDEGLAKALQHIHGVELTAGAADSFSNISRSEHEAIKHNKQHLEGLEERARQRKLKVMLPGLLKDFEMDYGNPRG